MISATIREAKAKLNELVDKAIQGEDVVLLRGSKHVVMLTPITDNDLEVAPRLSDEQAERFWQRLAQERSAGTAIEFAGPEEAAAVVASHAPPKRADKRGRRS